MMAEKRGPTAPISTKFSLDSHEAAPPRLPAHSTIRSSASKMPTANIVNKDEGIRLGTLENG